MKKLAILSLICVLSACGETSANNGFLSALTATDANSSVRQKMQSCMVSEAQSKFQAGTLFTKGLSETADELVSTCAKKLALQAAGISDDTRTAAENIITGMKNLAQ